MLNYNNAVSTEESKSPNKTGFSIFDRRYQYDPKDIIGLLSGCVICTSEAGLVTHVNDCFMRLSGLTENECIGKSAQELFHPEDSKAFQSAFSESVTRRTVSKLDLRIPQRRIDRLIDLAISIVPSMHEILIIGWNVTDQKEAERIARKKSHEILGKHLWKSYPELIGTSIYEKYTEAMDSGQPCRFEEYLPEFNAWFETNIFPSDEGLVVYFRETTDRKRSQEQLKKYAEELERSNQDLEQFAYIASHDLQEPLRMISSFVGLLSEENGDQLNEKSLRYIQFAQEGAERMRTLIRDLLEYSRVSAIEVSFQTLDMNQVVDFALLNLKQTIDDSNAEITLGTMPMIEGARAQFVLLFQTLISNALKFNVSKRPVISISSTKTEAGQIFCIKDNGIGIPPQHLENIFKIFKRLHSRSDYPGTGIGLAIAKKIVERYGGKIWATSTLDEGSSFYFLLPERGKT